MYQHRKRKVVPIIFSVLASLLIFNMMPVPANAKSLDAFLFPNEEETFVTFESLQVLNIQYPNGGDIATKLNGAEIEINLKVDSKEPGVQTLIKDINAYLYEERESPVEVTDLVIDYKGKLHGLTERTALSQKVTVQMTISGIVLGELDEQPYGKMIDLNWRTFIISQPVFVQSEEYGMVDINRPSGFLAATMPTLLKELATEGTLSLLNKPALDFSQFGLPMEKWKWQYDGDENVSVIVAVGGINTPLPPETYSVGFKHNGIPHAMELTIPEPSATIQILGFAKVFASEGSEAALVYEEPDIDFEINPFVVQILVVLGGVMAAIAIIVFIKSRK